MKRKYKIGLIVLVSALLISQFIPIDRSVPEMSPEQDFLTAVQAPPVMAKLIRSACYDCHSYETTYPWYTNVAPLSFFIQGHINGGRQHLNFSEWTSYTSEKASHKLEECFEEVDERHMPMKSYTFMHAGAKMEDAQVSALAQWFQQTYRSMNK